MLVRAPPASNPATRTNERTSRPGLWVQVGTEDARSFEELKFRSEELDRTDQKSSDLIGWEGQRARPFREVPPPLVNHWRATDAHAYAYAHAYRETWLEFLAPAQCDWPVQVQVHPS